MSMYKCKKCGCSKVAVRDTGFHLWKVICWNCDNKAYHTSKWRAIRQWNKKNRPEGLVKNTVFLWMAIVAILLSAVLLFISPSLLLLIYATSSLGLNGFFLVYRLIERKEILNR